MSDDRGAGPEGRLELGDIQGLALRAYRGRVARHVFLRVDAAAEARAWLGRLAGEVTTVASTNATGSEATLNLGLTWPGLRALGLPEDALASFPEEFRAGIEARAGSLGDTGESAPERWDPPLGTGQVHALLSLGSPDEEARERRFAELRAGMEEGGVTLVRVQDAAAFPDDRGPGPVLEHFGYRVGIGQPAVEGSGLEPMSGQGALDADGRSWRPLRAGEFILGQADETGRVPELPRPEALTRNGAFLVLRKLRQDVVGWRAFLRANARGAGGEELLAAKLAGRWRSGAPLALSPDRDDPALAADPRRWNAFSYADDPKGTACPLGAHARRMNPRAGLGDPGAHNVNRHRLFQRGLPYGPPLPEDAAGDDGVERGAVILLVCASIVRQFEFVQHVWANGGDFAGLGTEKDALIGDNDGTGRFTIPPLSAGWRPRGIPRFTTVRGGGYFFLPGITGLRSLAGT